MKKYIKKRVSTYLLSLFTLNLFIVPSLQPIAIPIAIPIAEVALRALVAFSGAAIAGLSSTYAKRYIKNSRDEKLFYDLPENEVVPTIVTTVVDAINTAQEAESNGKVGVDEKRILQIAVKNLTDTQLAEIKKGVEAQLYKGTLDVPREKSYFTQYVPGGMRIMSYNGRYYAGVQLTNSIAAGDARWERVQNLQRFNDLKRNLYCNEKYRETVTNNLRSITDTMLATQSDDIRISIPALFELESVAGKIKDPETSLFLSGLVHDTAIKLKGMYFHEDGTLCYNALQKPNAKAARLITLMADKIEHFMGGKEFWPTIDYRWTIPPKFTIRRPIKAYTLRKEEIIPAAQYEQLKAIMSSNVCNTCQGHTDLHSSAAEKVKEDFVKCFNACQEGDYKKAESLAQEHKGYRVFQDTVAKIKQAQSREVEAALYNEHGILRVAEQDPAYYQNAESINSETDKKAINENLLVRYHFKQQMHENWGIAQNAPEHVQKALYDIIGHDAESLSSLPKLQEAIENVLFESKAEERADLVKAFYNANGVLKEVALQNPAVKSLELPAKITSTTYTQQRKELNLLLTKALEYPELAPTCMQAAYLMQDWLTAPTRQEEIARDAVYQDAYENVLKLEKNVARDKIKAALSEQKGGGGAPSPKDPEPDEDKKKKEKKDVWDMPENGKTINGRRYTKHALERMAPDIPEVRAELERRALEKGGKRFLKGHSDKLLKYVQPRNIPPSVVEATIKNATPTPGINPGTFEYISNGIKVIVNLAGDVITVHPI